MINKGLAIRSNGILVAIYNRLFGKKCGRWGIVALYAGLIFLGSANPATVLHPFPFFDKFVHFVEFGILCALIFWALLSHYVVRGTLTPLLKEVNHNPVSMQKMRYKRLAVAAIALASFYGISDEMHQSFLSFRSSDIYDWLADLAGASAAGLACMFISIKIRNSRHQIR